MDKKLIILPNQLFEIKYIPSDIDNVIIWEHPHYFKKYKYNRLKLILHRSSMKIYEEYLKQNGCTVKYVNLSDKIKLDKNCIMFLSADEIKLPKIDFIENPNFLVSQDLQKKYRAKTNKFFFNNFYIYCKKELNILPNVKSMDKYNRKSISKDEIKEIPNAYKIKFSSSDKNILRNAILYIKKQFPNNPGPPWEDIEAQWNFPIKFNQATLLWDYFIKNKLKQGYSDYQDFMYFNDNKNKSQQVYHSGVSSSMNIGLLNPIEIVKDLLKINGQVKAKEAYIRQLFWREYQLYCYRYCKELLQKKNYFGGKKTLEKYWYKGDSGIYPLDFCIKRAFQTGYLHHIERLMIIGNFMLLSGIKSNDGFRWFMEFSIDSYEWVMFQNVYDMVFNNTGVN